MIIQNPFDEFGRIVSSGGAETAIEYALGGFAGVALVDRISRRFPALSIRESSDLAAHAESAVIAASLIDATVSDSIAGYSAAPINPLLGGVDSGGVRYRVTAQSSWVNTDTGNPVAVNVTLDLPTADDRAEIMRQINEAVDSILHEYEGRFSGGRFPDRDNASVVIQSLQKRY